MRNLKAEVEKDENAALLTEAGLAAEDFQTLSVTLAEPTTAPLTGWALSAPMP